jgi:thiol-disulfide isomerase/thioredoxin
VTVRFHQTQIQTVPSQILDQRHLRMVSQVAAGRNRYFYQNRSAMKSLPFILMLLGAGIFCRAQTPEEIISQVKEAQSKLKSVHYRLVRHDTLVQGMVRTITGESKLFPMPLDSIFGFRYWSKRDSVNSETVYDGRSVFYINHDKKTFERQIKPVMIAASMGSPGGQVIMPDLVRLDTNGARKFELTSDADYYYLKLFLADIDEYDVRKRSRVLTIDKKTMLPVASRSHQESLGKVQDLYYRVQEIHINDEKYGYDFSALFPDDYTAPVAREGNKKLDGLKGKDVPAFSFIGFDGGSVSSASFKGRLVLLDFWEVWCGPCIASMPKVEALQKKYKDSGLVVYGIIHEKEALASAKELVKKRKFGLQMGIGTEESNKAFSVNAIPLYILIDKTGKIVFTSEGYPEGLEDEIRKYL